MIRSSTTPRIFTLFVLTSLAACTPPASDGDETETGESGETGDPMVDLEACEDPGTQLLANAKPALPPSPMVQVPYTCTSGWGTDAPQLDAAWTVQIGEPASMFDFQRPVLAAHPDGGALVISGTDIIHYGSDGEPVWTMPTNATAEAEALLAVEEAGTILLALSDYNLGETTLTRLSGDGEELGVIDVDWNDPNAFIWGVTTFGTDVIIGAYDQDPQGNYETALIRLDVDGNQLLRKSTNTTNAGLLATTDDGVVLFGSFPGFLVALDDGEVLGMFSPSMGAVSNVIGFGNDFFMAGNVTGMMTADFGVGRYTSSGAEQWLQGYDRATLGDSARTLAAGPDGSLAVVGTTQMLNPSGSVWFSSQPIVFGVDPDGNALWQDRIAAHADPSAVVIDVDGDVYVAGLADVEGEADPNDEPPVLTWLRRYAP